MMKSGQVMNLIVVGGPVTGKVKIQITPDKPFSDIFVLIRDAVGDAQLWNKFQLHVAEIYERKVRATARLVGPTDTAASLGILPPSAAVVVLRPIGERPPSANPVAASSEAKVAAPPCDYRSRMIAIYEKYEPSKVGTVDATLKKFSGKEDAVIRQLVKKYGPEPENAVCSNNKQESKELATRALSDASYAYHSKNTEDNNKIENYRERLIAMYKKYDPSKLGLVNATLTRFQGKEEAVMQKLVQMYGPEPDDRDAEATPSQHRRSGNDADKDSPGVFIESFTSCGLEQDEKPVTAFVSKRGLLDKNTNVQASNLHSALRKEGEEGDKITLKPPPMAAVAGSLAVDSLASKQPKLESCGLQTLESPVLNKPLVGSTLESKNDIITFLKPEIGESDIINYSEAKRRTFSDGGAFISKVNCNSTTERCRAPELGSAAAVASQHWPVACEEAIASVTANPRLRCIVESAVESFSQKVLNSLRRTYWKKWLLNFAQNVGKKLLTRRIWEKTDDGVKFVDSVPHIYTVQDFDTHIVENYLCAKRPNCDFSDDLQKALRELLYTTKQQQQQQQEEEEELLNNGDGSVTVETGFFNDKELCPVRDTKKLAAALSAVAGFISKLTETREKMKSKERELAKLAAANEELKKMLAEKESSFLPFAEVEGMLDVLKTRCETAEEQLQTTTDKLRAAKYRIQLLQREAKNGNNTPAADLELVVQQKDSLIASLEQKLAKTRSRLREEQEKRKAIEVKHEEANTTAAAHAKKQAVETPKSTSAVKNKRLSNAGFCPRAAIPKGFFSMLSRAQKVPGRSTNEELTPHEVEVMVMNGGGGGMTMPMAAREKPLACLTDAELQEENERLEFELRQLNVSTNKPLVVNCPHCTEQLTPCSNVFDGPAESKAAFCFSCKKSFTFADIALIKEKKK